MSVGTVLQVVRNAPTASSLFSWEAYLPGPLMSERAASRAESFRAIEPLSTAYQAPQISRSIV